MPEMSDQISEGIQHLNLLSPKSIMSPSNAKSPFPKLHNPPQNIPPSDEEFEATLEQAREAVLSSNDPEMQLAWAQDALQQVDINTEDRTRLQNMQMRRPPTPTTEHNIKLDAMNIVSFLAGQQHPRAEYIKGMWWEFGKFGCKLDKKEAFRCYSRAADKGYTRAEYRIGMLYESSKDSAKALRHYHNGVNAGDAACLYRLGMMTIRGQHGQEQDPAAGLDLIRRSAAVADDNAAQGAYVYGMLLAGELPQIQLPPGLLKVDERAARIEIEKAAYMKFAKAQLRMGSAYELGALGCEANAAYSIHYYALAARQGDPEAEMGISKWFLVGHEGLFAKNEEIAYLYAQRAALSGFGNAEFALGYFNELGIHVPKNVDLALEWYKKAASNGNGDAKARIDGISHRQVLSRNDHENIAVNKIRSQFGSKRGPRPERFTQGSRLPSIGDGQQSHRRTPSSNYPPRASSAAPYPTEDGPPTLPPLGDRPGSAAPYPIGHDSMPAAYSNHDNGQGPAGSAFTLAAPPKDRPYSASPDRRQQRYPSGPGPVQRPATSVDAYGRPANNRIVSSPAGMHNGPPRPPKDYDKLDPNSPLPNPGRRPVGAGPRTPTSSMPANNTSLHPARTSSRPDSPVKSSHPGTAPSPGPDVSKIQTPGKSGKGPKTFEEMGVPASKQEQECVSGLAFHSHNDLN